MSRPDFDLCETEDAYQLCTPDQGLSCRFTGSSVLLFNAENFYRTGRLMTDHSAMGAAMYISRQVIIFLF